MIMDNKGKLFGKVNIIDLCIILVLIGVVGFAATKMTSRSTITSSGMEDYIMKFYTEETPDYIIDIIKVGGKVEDEQKNIDLGTITDVQIAEGYMHHPNSNGELVKSIKEGYSSCEITSVLKAQTFANGIIIDGNKYSVGHTFVIRADKSKIYLKISAIEKVLPSPGSEGVN